MKKTLTTLLLLTAATTTHAGDIYDYLQATHPEAGKNLVVGVCSNNIQFDDVKGQHLEAGNLYICKVNVCGSGGLVSILIGTDGKDATGEEFHKDVDSAEPLEDVIAACTQ